MPYHMNIPFGFAPENLAQSAADRFVGVAKQRLHCLLWAPSRPVIRQTGGSIYTAHLYRTSEMKLQTPANSARRGVLDGDFFALFGNLINAVGDIGHVEFQIKPPRPGVP